MTEQWQELKETIIELRDNDGTGTQQEVCKFLANYMDILEKQMQEPCEDEYVKVPKKALKYRTAGMVAYNAEWLKNNFDIERAVICGAQEPCEDAISRQTVMEHYSTGELAHCNHISRNNLLDFIEQLPPVTPQPCSDLISRKAILEEFENDQYHLEFCKEHHIERSISMEMVRIRLHDLPPVNLQPCENAISRQAVLDIVDSYSESQSNVEDVTQDIISDIVALPPVNLQSSGDLISRQSAIFLASDLKQDLPDDEHLADMVMAHNEGVLEYQTQLSLLPPVNPQKCDKCEVANPCLYCRHEFEPQERIDKE